MTDQSRTGEIGPDRLDRDGYHCFVLGKSGPPPLVKKTQKRRTDRHVSIEDELNECKGF